MKNLKIYLFFLLIHIAYSQTLKQLYIVHRHGDRTSPFSYPNSPYLNTTIYWTDGKGQLIKAGKERMLRIGKFVRDKYNYFVDDDVRKVKIISSGNERCLESNQFFMNGLLKSKYDFIENSNWQPFAIHTKDFFTDLMMNPLSTCKEAYRESKRMLDEYGKDLYKEYQDFYGYLTKKSGAEIKNAQDAFFLQDAIVSEQLFGYKLPDWVTQDVLNKLKDSKNKMILLNKNSRKLQRLRTGLFLNDLLKNIEKSIDLNFDYDQLLSEDEETVKKFYVYSTHDLFMSILMISFDAFNGQEIPFGATLIFELYSQNITKQQSPDELNFIKILYLNDTDNMNFYYLRLPGCLNENWCSLKEFMTLTRDLVANEKELKVECNVKPVSKKTNIELYSIDKVLIKIILIIVLLDIFVSLFGFLKSFSRKK